MSQLSWIILALLLITIDFKRDRSHWNILQIDVRRSLQTTQVAQQHLKDIF